MRLWPFIRRPEPAERKSLADPSAETLALFAGIPVGAHALGLARALTVPAVQSAIALISGSIASFDMLVEHREGKEWLRDDSHPIAVLLADQPNDWSSTFELVRDLVATALTHDRGALALVNKVDGRVVEVIQYEPAHYVIDYSADGRLEPSFKINNRPEPSANVIHLRGPFSRCPLSLAAEAIGVAKNMESHAGNLFKNGAKVGGVIEFPKGLGDDSLKRMKAAWKAAHEGPENAGRTAILWDGATWKQATLSSVDAEFLATWKHVILEICRAFRIPPQLLYDHDRVTWANGEQAAKEWLAGLEFWMRPLEAAMRRALFSDEDRPNWRIRFDRDDYTNVDLTARAAAISSLVSSRVLNPNEGRAWLDLAPYAEGDRFLNPNITVSTRTTGPASEKDEA
jgi:HK97 family phage portal protein